ncbi:MAG: 16S rRNA (cytosine(1402)-N(4))-methyltransferase RsmH [bacterium]
MARGEGHVPVLYKESLEAMHLKEDSICVDATFGRGGHSAGILQHLGEAGMLLAMDKDPVAAGVARARFIKEEYVGEPRFYFKQGSFAQLGEFVAQQGVAGKVNSVLMDLGVSSPQLDEAERGFSFRQDGPLDMRMNPDAGESAADWLAGVSESELVRVLRDYGEERFAGRIARAIVARREDRRFETTTDLADVVRAAIPKWEKHKDPATRSFQAIRIQVNNELGDLEAGLEGALEALAPGGRLAVISFHSLEDRIVKRFMRRHSTPDPALRGLPLRDDELDVSMRLASKAIRASRSELEHNPRARSSVLRVTEKLK